MLNPTKDLPKVRLLGLSVLLGAAMLPGNIWAQQNVPGTESSQEVNEDDVYELSPFNVDSSSDFGYVKTVDATATRIGIPIVATPLNIQVLTEDFLDDVGAYSFENAFRYTSGVNLDLGGNGPGRADWYLRGIRASGGGQNFIFRDGFRTYYNYSNLDGVDSVNIVKGPNAVYFGRITPGGLINYVTKRPQFKNGGSIEATVGSDAYYKGLIDGQVVTWNDQLGVRAVVSRLDAETFLEHSSTDRDYALVSARVRLFDRWELTQSVEWEETQYRGQGFNVLYVQGDYLKAFNAGTLATVTEAPSTQEAPNGDDFTLPGYTRVETVGEWQDRMDALTPGVDDRPRDYTAFWFPRGYDFNISKGSFLDSNAFVAVTESKLNIFEGLDWRAAFAYSRQKSVQGLHLQNQGTEKFPVGPVPVYNRDGALSRILPAVTGTGWLNKGFGAFNMFAGGEPEGWFGSNQNNTNWIKTFQTDLSYTFELGETKHTFVASYEYVDDEYRSDTPLLDVQAFYDAGVLPELFGPPGTDSLFNEYVPAFFNGFNSGWKAVNVLSDTFYDESYDLKALTQGYRLGDPSTRESKGYAGSYRGQFFGDRLNVLLGGRHQEDETDSNKNSKGASQERETEGDTGMAGLSFEVVEGLYVFGSVSQSFQVAPQERNPFIYLVAPGGAETLYTADPGGEVLSDEEGLGWDIGVKTNFDNNKISGTLSYFQVERSNVANQDTVRQKPYQDGFDTNSDGVNEVFTLKDEFGNTGNLVTTSGEVKTAGIEVDVIYTPIPNYTVVLSWTEFTQREIVKDSPSNIAIENGGTFDGPRAGENATRRTLRGVPERMIGLFNKYTFTEGFLERLEVGAGVSYNSGSWVEQEVKFDLFQDEYFLVDFLLGYTYIIDERYAVELTLNVNNVFDEHYVQGTVGLSEPRTWKLTAALWF